MTAPAVTRGHRGPVCGDCGDNGQRFSSGNWRRLLAGPGPAGAPGSRFAGTEDIRGRQVVPRATLADLDHVDLELCIFHGHFVQFRAALDPPLVPSELVTVDVGNVREL